MQRSLVTSQANTASGPWNLYPFGVQFKCATDGKIPAPIDSIIEIHYMETFEKSGARAFPSGVAAFAKICLGLRRLSRLNSYSNVQSVQYQSLQLPPVVLPCCQSVRPVLVIAVVIAVTPVHHRRRTVLLQLHHTYVR